jgi:hypothetical protein
VAVAVVALVVVIEDVTMLTLTKLSPHRNIKKSSRIKALMNMVNRTMFLLDAAKVDRFVIVLPSSLRGLTLAFLLFPHNTSPMLTLLLSSKYNMIF